MRSAAALIASLLPFETAGRIRQITGGRHLVTVNDDLRLVANPELPAIARMMPANAACQIVRVANRTESDCSEVTAEVANIVGKEATVPKRVAARDQRINVGRGQRARVEPNPARLTTLGFPGQIADSAGIVTPGIDSGPGGRQSLWVM